MNNKFSEFRDFGVRAKLAQEFIGFVDGSNRKFRSLFDSKGIYEKIYYPHEIRQARLQLLGHTELTASKKQATLPPIITSRMAKGGTGKTTLCAGVATTLAMNGLRVLLIDGDPQASLTSLFGIDWSKVDITHIGTLMYKYHFKQPYNLQEAIIPLYKHGMLDLIASDISLANADSWLMSATNREFTFKKLLDSNVDVLSNYDVVIIDSAPSTNLLTNTFMCACKKILAVVWLDGQSLMAMKVLANNVNELNEAFHQTGFHLGVHIVANGYHQSYGTCKEAMGTLCSSYPNNVNDNIIPHSSSFMRQVELLADKKSGTVLEREPNSVAARSIIELTKSLIKEYDIKIGTVKII
ncbi:ParA family protein [Methylomonas sp. AM2-LC]|uniref:ParA family protein n=1 Tax=Methylomonas sp. AM2-LC TaxID=3153301 RepID=UPI003265527D